MTDTPTEARVELDALPPDDLVALAALKLTVEVDAEPTTALELARDGAPEWRLAFLRSGPGTIGADPIDGRSLGRARAQRVRVESQRAPVAPPPDVCTNGAWPAPLPPSSEMAVETFAALDDLDDLDDEDFDIEVSGAFEAEARRAPTDILPVVSAGPPAGFHVTGPQPSGLPLDVTLTQHVAG